MRPFGGDAHSAGEKGAFLHHFAPKTRMQQAMRRTRSDRAMAETRQAKLGERLRQIAFDQPSKGPGQRYVLAPQLGAFIGTVEFRPVAGVVA